MKGHFRVAAIAAVFATGQAVAFAQAPSIAIMPVVNSTGEKWEELRTKLTERVNAQLHKIFGERGFSITPPHTLKALLDEQKFDMTDEENHRREPLFGIGEKLETDYVVFFVITHNTQRTKVNFLTSMPEGEVTVKFWLLDVKKRQPVYSAKSETAKARPHAWGGVAKGSDQQLTAADRVVEAALKEFLAPYPVKKGG